VVKKTTSTTTKSRSDIAGHAMHFTGRIPSVNEWHGVSHGRIFEKPKYKSAKREMRDNFWSQWVGEKEIDYYVDCTMTLVLWKVRDTDDALKPIFDAIEEAGIIKNDKLIRNIVVGREYHAKNEPDGVFIVFTTVPIEERP